MRFLRVIRDDDDQPDGNVYHIAEHGLTIQDVGRVLENPLRKHLSRSTGRPCCFGCTPGGDFIIVVYEQIDEHTIYPITLSLLMKC